MGIEQEIHIGGSLPRRVVVYSPYHYFIYFDDKFAGMVSGDVSVNAGIKFMCDRLGIEVEWRGCSYNDWPNFDSDQYAHTKAPERLSELEEHFRRLEAKNKTARIAQLEAELKTLKGN